MKPEKCHPLQVAIRERVESMRAGAFIAAISWLISAGTAICAQAIPYTVPQVQRALDDAGYETGIPDGIWGRKSAAALKSFQQDRHIAETGIMDQPTREKLFPVQEAIRAKVEVKPTTVTRDVEITKQPLTEVSDTAIADQTQSTQRAVEIPIQTQAPTTVDTKQSSGVMSWIVVIGGGIFLYSIFGKRRKTSRR